MEDLPAITPVNFFQFAADVHTLPKGKTFPRISEKELSKFLLPDLSFLLGEEYFADVAMGWSEDGIECAVKVNQPFTECAYPLIRKGDSFELFIDTRNIKTSGFNTRFCHHFFFLPESTDGIQAGELTRFRTEDAHELCDGNDLQICSFLKKDRYMLHCFIPKECLTGFDPLQFPRLGASYRINRPGNSPQHFSATGEDYSFEQLPSLWAEIRLVP